MLKYSTNYRENNRHYYNAEPASDREVNHYLRPKSFDFKSSIVGELANINYENQGSKDEIRFVVPLKRLSNFWRSFSAANVSNVKTVVNVSATFQIADTKLYVPVVTLLTENDKKLLEQDLKELLNGINTGQK